MKTFHFSRVELGIITNYWKLYVQFNTGNNSLPDDHLAELNQEMEQVASQLSPGSRETFLGALECFENGGEEFEVRIAPDDVSLVS